MSAVVDKATASTIDKALVAAEAAQSKKGFGVTIVNVEGLCSYTDAIVIVSASNERQTKAIAETVEEALRTQMDIRPIHREGLGSWVLVDYGDLVVHLFIEDTRAYYDIDKLWSDAPRVAVPAPAEQAGAEASASALARRRR